MRKILSFIVATLMLVSMFGFMTTGVSANTLKSTYEDAKDGDLLYEVLFGQNTGVYVPTQFNALISGDLDKNALEIYNDGRALAFYKPSVTSGASYYGGAIEGLKMGDDKTYTITMRVTLPPNRGGIYFNFPTGSRKQALTGTSSKGNDCTYNSVLYGIYGRFDESGDIGSMKGGSRVAGSFIFNKDGYVQFDEILVKEGTFLDVAFLIEGYTYAVFVEGKFLDVIDVSAVKGVADDLGFSVYLYHIKENTPMVVKDVNIYKGDLISANATYPAYAREYAHYIAPSSTTEETTTVAPPVTDSPEEVTTEPQTSIETQVTEGGCSSAIVNGFSFISLVSLAATMLVKTRKN